MRDIGSTAGRMEKVEIFPLMGISMKDSIRMIIMKELANIPGKMVVCTKVNG